MTPDEQAKKADQSRQHQEDRKVPPHQPGDHTQAEPGKPGGPVKPVLPVQPATNKQKEANPTFDAPVPPRQGLPNEGISGPKH